MRGAARLRASSVTDRARAVRAGFALGTVGLFVSLLAVGALAMWFVTSTTQKNIARAVAGQTYLDACYSAVAEVTSGINHASTARTTFVGRDFGALLTTVYPFKELEIEPAITRRMLDQLYPGVTVSKVKIKPVSRTNPGEGDPVVGVLELTVEARGRIGGASTGRQLVQRYLFVVSCAFHKLAAPTGGYARAYWGVPVVETVPSAQVVKGL